MKIAFINMSFGKVNRGAETYVGELSTRLTDLGHEVVILTAKKNRLPRWPILWRLYLDPFGIQAALFTLSVIPAIVRQRYDVVIPVDGGWQPALVRLATWVYGGKMVISGQSGLGWDDRNNLWCFPDRFIALSSFGQKWAKKANPFVHISYIPNGVDLVKFKPSGSKLLTSLRPPIILCVSALSPIKRVDLVIQAVAKLPDVSLLIVGKGPEEARLKKLADTHIKARYEFRSLAYAKMPSAYRVANVFTLVSAAYISFEMVLVEAMASGLGVVANDDEIRKEIVGDAGLFVDPSSAVVYAVALRRALDTNWQKSPRKQASKFSWVDIAKQYDRLLTKLISHAN